MRHLLVPAFVIGAVLPAVLWAGKITLTDGTVVEGDIKKSSSGTSYLVRTADGQTKIISAGQVRSVDDPALNAAAGGSTAAGTAGGGPVAAGNAAGDFGRTQRTAEKADAAVIAITLWQKFIDTHKASPDLPAAQKELARWQDMDKKGAERVNGKWVVGEDLKKLHKHVSEMLADARRMLNGDQTLKGVEKYREVLKIYPNSFEANFELGYYDLKQIARVEGSNAKIDASIRSLETAAKLKPNSPSTLSNLAIAYNFRKRYEESVLMAYKAAQLQDDEDIVSNLYMAINNSPPGMRKNDPKIVPVLPDARLLIERRGVKSAEKWTYVRPRDNDSRGEGNGEGELRRHGVVGSGTGFFIAADGYIITNRHVAAAGDRMIVITSDDKHLVAEKVVVDDDQDIAILKVKSDKPVPFIRIADYDEPPVGTDVTVMGFPLGASMGMHVKITRGVVTSVEEGKESCDVIVDAQVNPGNSGGPMLDKNGNLLALVAMKTLAVDESISSYGLGISPKRLRTFFEHQKDKLTAVHLGSPEKAAAAPLTTEDIAKKYTAATVMVLIVSGDMDGLKN